MQRDKGKEGSSSFDSSSSPALFTNPVSSTQSNVEAKVPLAFPSTFVNKGKNEKMFGFNDEETAKFYEFTLKRLGKTDTTVIITKFTLGNITENSIDLRLSEDACELFLDFFIYTEKDLADKKEFLSLLKKDGGAPVTLFAKLRGASLTPRSIEELNNLQSTPSLTNG